MGETERRREQPQVAVIPATRRAVRAGGQITGAGRLRVAAYCRVSTGDESQQTSYVKQKIYYTELIRKKAEWEMAGIYADEAITGTSRARRQQFNQMMEDIKSGKDGVSYVLVFKLSRFGRNAADVLATLQVMQDFGVNLICVEDGIDSSKDAGKLMISVLSAVAEIERENIRVQTMEGRMQKAREGKWNGGFAPYGYSLIDGKLEVNEEEAVAIRMIFDQYVNTDLSIGRLRKTIPCLLEGLSVLKAWGFTYKTVGFVWVKQNRKADSLFWGMGYWTRSNVELCILATKGHPKRINAAVHQVIVSHIEEHSKKPQEARERIVSLMGDLPRIELFARQSTPGWDVWGNEVDSSISFP